jgi:hypothetical protein
MMNLALVLTTSWQVWSGADPHIVEMARNERDDDLEERVGNAIEMAIISKARRFIKSSPCQKVIGAIWMYVDPLGSVLSTDVSNLAENVYIRRKVVIRSCPM